MRYGLRIPESILFGYKGQYEFTQKYHCIVQRYLDDHPELHKELLDNKGEARYYNVLKKALTPDEWKEFMKPQPWEKYPRELDKLRAERDRYRSALENILTLYTESGMEEVAKQALAFDKEKEGKNG